MTARPGPARARPRWAGSLAIAPLGVLLAVGVLWPDPPAALPAHWSPRGVDGTVGSGAYYAAVLTVTGLAAVAATLVTLLSVLVPQGWSRWVLAALATVGAGAVAGYGLAVLGASLTGDAGEVGAVWGLAAAVVGVAWGALTYAVHARTVPDRAAVLAAVPERARVGVRTAEQPGRRGSGPTATTHTWSAPSASPLLRTLGAFVVVVLGLSVALLLAAGDRWAAVAVAGLGVLLGGFLLAWSRTELTVEEGGLVVRSRLLPVTLLRVPAEDVVGVEVVDLDPTAWGGWGLRTRPDRTAYIVSGGPGLLVHRATGTRLALEVVQGREEAERGALALRRAVEGQAEGTSVADS